MQFFPLWKPLALAVVLVLSAIVGPVAAGAQHIGTDVTPDPEREKLARAPEDPLLNSDTDTTPNPYQNFRDCLRKHGTGLACSGELPDGDNHRLVFENWNKMPDQWPSGGLSTPSAAAILLKKQLSGY